MKPDLGKLRKLFSQNFEIKECTANDLNRNSELRAPKPFLPRKQYADCK